MKPENAREQAMDALEEAARLVRQWLNEPFREEAVSRVQIAELLDAALKWYDIACEVARFQERHKQ